MDESEERKRPVVFQPAPEEACAVESLHYVKKGRGGHMLVLLSTGHELKIDPELAVKWRLKSGFELPAGQARQLRDEEHNLQARYKLVRHLSLRRKTTREARQYLQQAGYNGPAIDAALAKSVEMGLLDDTQLATDYAAKRPRSARKGPRAVNAELISRGISREDAKLAVDSQTTKESQTELARNRAMRKARSLAKIPVYEARQKLSAHLMRHGFEGDVVRIVVDEALPRVGRPAVAAEDDESL